MDEIIANTIRFGVVQIGSAPGAPEENLRMLQEFSQQAKDAGCTAVCFPEGF